MRKRAEPTCFLACQSCLKAWAFFFVSMHACLMLCMFFCVSFSFWKLFLGYFVLFCSLYAIVCGFFPTGVPCEHVDFHAVVSVLQFPLVGSCCCMRSLCFEAFSWHVADLRVFPISIGSSCSLVRDEFFWHVAQDIHLPAAAVSVLV